MQKTRSADFDEDINTDDKQAWISNREHTPLEVDPSKGSRSRRKIDILAMMVSIIGSKDQLVSEYQIHFGDNSMQRCEIMTNDLIDSKRTNSNIKAPMMQPSLSGTGQEESELSIDQLDVKIISSNFWPPIQASFFIVYVVTSRTSVSTEVTRLVPLIGDWIGKYYLECTYDRVDVPSIPYHMKYPEFSYLSFLD